MTSYRWPAEIARPAERAAHLGVRAEQELAAGDIAEASALQHEADVARGVLASLVLTHVAMDPHEESAELVANWLTGQVMRAAYAKVRGAR
jgi:hypothetical protein